MSGRKGFFRLNGTENHLLIITIQARLLLIFPFNFFAASPLLPAQACPSKRRILELGDDASLSLSLPLFSSAAHLSTCCFSTLFLFFPSFFRVSLREMFLFLLLSFWEMWDTVEMHPGDI